MKQDSSWFSYTHLKTVMAAVKFWVFSWFITDGSSKNGCYERDNIKGIVKHILTACVCVFLKHKWI